MKHFIIFKYGRFEWTKVYEYFGTLTMAKKFQKSLSESMGTVLILCEVI